jgi:hydroxymethylpyrimidine pyrophosphatase-like HAD family hydrolase
MPYRYRGFAIDYDGTLAESEAASPAVLEAVAEVRGSGRRVVLVTGRIMDELRAVFPDVQAHFDAIVAENGCILVSSSGRSSALADPIDPSLGRALEANGVPYRTGEVLLATKAAYAPALLDAIEGIGLELQLIRNRSELMVLPSGTNKGTGLIAALAEVGVDRHNVVAIGDAENDHSLFAASEIGVAVGNAIDSLKDHADVVLSQENGHGVASFLRQVVNGDLALVEPARWQVELGKFADGGAVRIPAAAVGIGIYGESGGGKSYLAGLLAEGLLRLEYRTCVIDPEGDHTGLAELPGVVVVGGSNPLPAVDDVISILLRAGASVVLDMSLHDDMARASYARQLVKACQASREQTGLPHCLIVDEAHSVFGPAGTLGPLAVSAAGLCLVTYRPDLLSHFAHERLDYRITVRSVDDALIEARQAGGRRFRPAPRRCRHGRHAEKYMTAILPAHRRFHFLAGHVPTGRSAGSLREFRDEVAFAPDAVLLHHARQRDFSRWLRDLCRDCELAKSVARIEADLVERRTANGAARFRNELFAALGDRYPI